MFKKIKTLFIALVVTSASALAQSPSQINYQGAARDGAGAPIANQQIRVRLKVHDGASNGTVQYSEVRKPATNANGLFNIVIGSTGALSTTGSFAAITWGSGNKYLQVEMDPTGGTAYINMGTQQIVSVPYAQYANTAGAIKFPMSATDSLSSTMFTLTNKNQNAIDVNSVNGIAVYGWSNNNNAVFGANNSTSQSAVSGFNYSSGAGVTGYSQNGIGVAGNNASTTWAAVQGANNLGVGVEGKSASYSGAGVFGTNTGTGPGVKGEAYGNGGTGVAGYSNFATGIGVYGSSTLGTAVKGYSLYSTGVSGVSGNYTGVNGTSTSGTGVYGTSSSGTGVYANSTTGLALDVNGKLKISGTSQAPAQGKVLTSDANGNATWQGAIAFSESGIATAGLTIPDIGSHLVQYYTENYDLGNNFNTTTNRFIVPVNGIYHFDVKLGWSYLTDDMGSYLYLKLKRGNTIYTLDEHILMIDLNGWEFNSISGDYILQPNDEIYVEIQQGSGYDQYLDGQSSFNRFNGRLVVKL